MKGGPELAWPTPPAWAEHALAAPLELLSDHAHCELGAAASAQALIARHPGLGGLVERMSALAIEELRHFRRVQRLLASRGGELRAPRRNPYAEGLLGRARRGAADPLLEKLLVAALIERRSLERFELLAAAARDGRAPLEDLALLYGELAPSEAGHARLFLELARDLFPAPRVEERLAVWAAREAELIRGLPCGPRVHSGPPARGDGPRVEKTRPAAERGPGAFLS